MQIKRGLNNVLFIDDTYWRSWFKWLIASIKDTPSGLICKHCNRLNLFFDDCGWFSFVFASDKNKNEIGCYKCWNSKDGDYHRFLYGVGER